MHVDNQNLNISWLQNSVRNYFDSLRVFHINLYICK